MANISAIKLPDNTTYNIKAGAIPYGEVDSTSTSTAYTATVPGINELKNGTIMLLRNGAVTSASGFKININGLGAKPVYNNLATGNTHTPTNPTRDTTIFNINYTMLFIYDEELVSGGAWICYRGYDANTNTIGYQLRGNNGTRPASDKGYRYRLWLSSLDNQNWVPINTSTATDASTSRSLNSRVIDPFGEIVYYAYNGTTNAAANLTATNIWQQYTLTIGYSYVKSLTAWDPVYLKCEPQASGGAVMKDIVQALPSTADGFIYIYLGIAYSTTAMELCFYHPVYYHDGTGIRAWTGIKVPTKTSELTNDSGYTSFSGSYNDLTDKPTIPVLPSNIVNTVTTTAGAHTTITNKTGNVSFSVPTKTSDLMNDSGFITSDSDEKLKVTADVTTGTEYYPVLSTSSTTAETKQRSPKLSFSNLRDNYVFLTIGHSDSRTQGALRLRTATQNGYTDLATRATSSKLVYLPDKAGTIALTDDIPTVPTNVSAFTNDAGYITVADLPAGPLIGNTSDITPTQVLTALQAGRDVYITYSHELYGNIIATYFNYSAAFNIIITNIVALYNDGSSSNYMLFSLAGFLENNKWQCIVTALAEKSDIPYVPTNISELYNDSGYITASDVEDEIFIATYNTTSYSDILSAYNNGKIIFCKDESTYAPLTNGSSGVFYFRFLNSLNVAKQYYVNSSGWSSGSFSLVTTDRTINGKSLGNNITLTASDVGALPSSTDVTKWNGIALAKQEVTITNDLYVPTSSSSTGDTAMSFSKATATPTASKIAKYDANAYLNSTTPAAGDNSTKVATTAYVQSVLPIVPSRGTPTSGGTTLSVVNTGDMYTWNNKSQVQIVRW